MLVRRSTASGDAAALAAGAEVLSLLTVADLMHRWREGMPISACGFLLNEFVHWELLYSVPHCGALLVQMPQTLATVPLAHAAGVD